MTLVVFLRGVNVGGNRKFSPAALAREMSDLDVVNVGAAGTFVVRKAQSRAALRAEFLRRLPFETEIMICSGREVLELVESQPFPAGPADARRFVSVVATKPRRFPRLPLLLPDGDAWQVQVCRISDPFVLSLWRPAPRPSIYLDVIEGELGVAATTRSWSTIEKVCKILEAKPAG